MEPGMIRRFDPSVAARLFLDLASEHSLDRALQKVVGTISKQPELACMQIWCLAEGDRCAHCAFEKRCPEHHHCLHLAAGQGNSVALPGQTASYFADPASRIPLGVGLLGQVAGSRQSVILQDFEATAIDLAGIEWVRRENIQSLGVSPIVFKGELLGVLVGYSRQFVPEEAQPWMSILTDHVAAVMANTRAFEEIQRLKAQLEQHNTYLQEEVVEAKAFGDLVGKSRVLLQLISQVELVAPTEASILILGETGTGKELVAHEIHRRSQRSRGPLVRVNCASIPRELFGHVRGSFTGALKDRAGRIETAEGGTLFLDEIGELPLDMQSKLLRFLQEKKYERIGEDRTRHANVRIIGATNRDLKKAITAGRFREDLYYRLHVFPIQVAPLRERAEDIPLLAEHFISLSIRELKCAKPRLTRAAVASLLNYHWPGNVRELRNVIERAVILAQGAALHFDLPAAHPIQAPAPMPKLADPAPTRSVPSLMTEAELRNLERENLLATLQAAHWKMRGPNGAAEMLGVNVSTLYSRMAKMGIKPPAADGSSSEPETSV
jgi:transcriptional regulator with GAF, ATPase, and Fis domain